MTLEEALALFENLYIEDRVSSIDDATAALAGWISRRSRMLTEEDIQLLSAVGAVLYSKGMESRVETPEYAKTAAEALIDAFRLKKK